MSDIILSPHRPTLSPALYRLIVLARHAEKVTNIGVGKILAPAKISVIFAKL